MTLDTVSAIAALEGGRLGGGMVGLHLGNRSKEYLLVTSKLLFSRNRHITPSQHPCIPSFVFLFPGSCRVFAVGRIHMDRQFIVAGTTGVDFRDPMPLHGAKSACDPFPPYRRLQLHDTPVEFVFLILGGGAGACVLVVKWGSLRVLLVSMGWIMVPDAALVALAAISLRILVISSY